MISIKFGISVIKCLEMAVLGGEKMNRPQLNVKDIIFLHLKALVLLALLYFTIWHCPIRLMFGVPCPGCGTTRACISFLKLDVRTAFAYQPVFPLLVLIFLYAIHRNVIRSNWIMSGRIWKDRIEAAVLAAAVLTILLVYFVRLVRQDSPVMEISPEKGLVFRMAVKIREFLLI